MSRRRRIAGPSLVTAAVLAATTLATAVLVSGPSGAEPLATSGRTYVVSPTGDDRGPGTAAAPFRTIQRAVAAARPGVTIQLQAGTYTGPFLIDGVSGTRNAPITLEAAGDGPVVLTADLPPVPCNRSQPAARTLNFGSGVDYWTVAGLRIRGGIGIKGTGWHAAFTWLKDRVSQADWRARRAVPGHGPVADEAAAKADLPQYLARQIGAPIDPADGISIIGNTLTGRGIWTVLARQGVAADNTITDIACGTGPAAWFNTFSDSWRVTHNVIDRVAASAYSHYMQEGIRLGSATSYVQVESNQVSDIHGTGRAFSTDVDASYNTFSRNTATDVYQGFNEQMSGWGNVWEFNTVRDFSSYGFAVRVMDGRLSQPSWDSSSYRATFRCNAASGGPVALAVGAARDDTFTGNSFAQVQLSDNLRAYWSAQGNHYDNLTAAPGAKPALSATGC
ncbi:MAG TPA: DUF1565 domain-containing protein [Mycobacteriales bacterium]|nr:DUF1565 domain-containing protein [Mycobacteriales bacterium]